MWGSLASHLASQRGIYHAHLLTGEEETGEVMAVAVLTQGGPNKASEVLLFTMYQQGFTYLRLGHSAAITLVFLAVVLALMWVQTRVLDRRVHYS